MNLASLTESLSRLPFVGLFVRAFRKGSGDYAKDMAASIAFFSFFSLFPLLLGIAAGASVFLDPAEIESRLDKLLADTFPGSADWVTRNMQAVIQLRGAAGVVSIVGLLWSASKMFGAVSRGVNRALGLTRTHPALLSRLRYFLLTLTVPILLFVALAVSTGLDLITQFVPDLLGEVTHKISALVGGHVASFILVLVMLGWIYKLVPYERPSWREVIPGALVASLLIELGKAGFLLYLDYMAHLEAVYGSVSSVIVLLIWLYFSARALLFGAEIIAVRREQVPKAPTTP